MKRTVESLLRVAQTRQISNQAINGRECSKKHVLSLSEGSIQRPVLSRVEGKAATVVTRGAYAAYVSANAAKSATSVSPKIGNTARTPLARLRAEQRTGWRLFSTFPKAE